ncbi:MAG TPA: serine hydrolase [Terriglobales bacterium]|nr:serine hydrolase [Terriglobales bacterium]
MKPRKLCALFLLILSLGAFAQVPKETKPQKAVAPAPQPPAAAHPLTAEDLAGFFDAAVPMQLERENIAGAVVAVVKDGQVIFEKGYGYADVKTRKPVSPTDTLFRPGSVSKLFTWTAVMQLVEAGKLDLDRDVNDYLDFKIPATHPQPITLRHLLTHTPGFEETDKDLFVAQPERMQPLGDYMKQHLPRRRFAPGTTPSYSNYGAALAGYIVQRASGQPFDDYVEQHILGPLSMKHSTFRQPLPKELAPLMSSGYRKASDDAKEYEWVNVPPAGSMAVSADDVTRFMLAHLEGGRWGSAQLLQPATLAQMHERQARTWSNPALNGMALGFYEESRNGQRILGHGGDTLWFHSDLHLIPAQRLGFFVSYNSAGKGEISPRGPLWRAFLDRYFPYRPPDLKASGDDKAVLGSYATSRRCDGCILRMAAYLEQLRFHPGKDGTIVADGLKSANGTPRQWKQVGPMLFQDVNGQEKLGFTRMPDGTMRMSANANIVVFERAPWYLSSHVVLGALVGSITIFALTLILWPVGALVRRHYGRPLPETAAGRGRLAVYLVCALQLAVLLTWIVWLSMAGDDIGMLASQNDKWLHLLQLAQWLAVLLTLVPLAAMARAWFRPGLWWWARVWYTAIALAALAFVWFTFTMRMLDWSLRY